MSVAVPLPSTTPDDLALERGVRQARACSSSTSTTTAVSGDASRSSVTNASGASPLPSDGVHEDDVRDVAAQDPRERLRRRRPAPHVETGAGEQVGERGQQQRGPFADPDRHGDDATGDGGRLARGRTGLGVDPQRIPPGSEYPVMLDATTADAPRPPL